MSDITLTLKLEETNAVLQALGQLPYSQVEPLVAKIREQAIPQVQKIQESQPAPEAPKA